MASADAAEPEEEEELVPTNPSRGLMYILISLHGMPNWMIRGGIFSWMPFVVRELGLSEAQRALLMGAWFPGYAFAQMPAAALIMRIGAKKVIGLNLLGTCGAYLALPFVAALGGSTAMQVRLMAACLAVAGLCQAPLVAGQKTMQRNWLPKIGSPSRPIHHKLVSLGELFGQGILANALTPWIASNFGWRAVNYAMGGGGGDGGQGHGRDAGGGGGAQDRLAAFSPPSGARHALVQGCGGQLLLRHGPVDPNVLHRAARLHPDADCHLHGLVHAHPVHERLHRRRR
jgi:MFS family permease